MCENSKNIYFTCSVFGWAKFVKLKVILFESMKKLFSFDVDWLWISINKIVSYLFVTSLSIPHQFQISKNELKQAKTLKIHRKSGHQVKFVVFQVIIELPKSFWDILWFRSIKSPAFLNRLGHIFPPNFFLPAVFPPNFSSWQVILLGLDTPRNYFSWDFILLNFFIILPMSRSI